MYDESGQFLVREGIIAAAVSSTEKVQIGGTQLLCEHQAELDLLMTPFSVLEVSHAIGVPLHKCEQAIKVGKLQKSCIFNERDNPSTNLPNTCDIVRYWALKNCTFSSVNWCEADAIVKEIVDVQLMYLPDAMADSKERAVLNTVRLRLSDEEFWVRYFEYRSTETLQLNLLSKTCQAWRICLKSLMEIMQMASTQMELELSLNNEVPLVL